MSVAGGQAVIATSGRNNHRGAGQRTITCSFATIAGLGSYGPELTDLVPDTKVWRTCYDIATGQRVSGPIVITVGAANPARPAVTQALIDMALANIDINLPALTLSPPDVTLPNFDTWLWIADQPVETASATAAGVTITVTASLDSTAFEFNAGTAVENGGTTVSTRDDGITLRCSGTGRRYDPTRGPAAQATDCHHRFSAPTRNFTIDTTSSWHITWKATNGTTGDLGTVQRTSAHPYRVQEKQSVIRTP